MKRVVSKLFLEYQKHTAKPFYSAITGYTGSKRSKAKGALKPKLTEADLEIVRKSRGCGDQEQGREHESHEIGVVEGEGRSAELRV